MIDYKKTAVKLLGLILIVIGVLGTMFLGVFFWPFLIAIVIALSLEKIVNFMYKKINLPKKLTGVILVVITYTILGFIIYLIISRLIKEVIIISDNMPQIYDYMVTAYKSIYLKYNILMKNAPAVVSDNVYNTGIKALELGTSFITKVFNSIVNFIIFMPSILIYIIITFLATLFLVTDRREIKIFMTGMIPDNITIKVSNILKSTLKSLGKYLRAQLIIISITFIELFVAFTILKQPYPLTLALVIALIDALPILGTGTVLLPWAIYAAITGNVYLAVALIIIYVIILIVRQLVEPKIVSNQLGVHPFITLIAMYIGFKLFGLIGMIIGPIVMVIFKNVFNHLFEAGYFKNFIIYKEKNLSDS